MITSKQAGVLRSVAETGEPGKYRINQGRCVLNDKGGAFARMVKRLWDADLLRPRDGSLVLTKSGREALAKYQERRS